MPAMRVAPSRIEPHPVIVFMTSFRRCDASASSASTSLDTRSRWLVELIVRAEHVVAEVLELLRVLVADPLHLAVSELRRDLLHRVDLVLERDELAADVEQLALDLLRVVPLQALGAEDPGFDRLDRALDLAGPVEAVVDQGVEDAPHELSERT